MCNLFKELLNICQDSAAQIVASLWKSLHLLVTYSIHNAVFSIQRSFFVKDLIFIDQFVSNIFSDFDDGCEGLDIMSSSSRRSSSRNQKEDEKIKSILFDSKVNPYEKVMNEYEQNKREYPHANQKQWLKEARSANIVPENYICNRCHQKGHFIYDCPKGKAGEGNNVKRSTGIPRSFLQAASADTPGAKINPQGKFVQHFFQ